MKYLLPFLITLLVCCAPEGHNTLIAIGTYSDTIHLYMLDSALGTLSPQGFICGMNRPSFLVSHPSGKYIYAVNETLSGGVTALSVDRNNGSLTYINSVSSRGADPCYLDISGDGRTLLVSNYSSGNWSVIPVKADGALMEASQTIENGSRSHVHCAQFADNDKSVWVADLGLDRVYAYQFLIKDEHSIDTMILRVGNIKLGSGPRHLVDNRNLKIMYLLNEHSGRIDLLVWARDSLVVAGSVMPENFNKANSVVGSADIHITPDHRFLYASHRGAENSITQYAIKPDGGLDYLASFDCGGVGPRNFMIDPTGKFLIVANQISSNVVVFAIDPATGALAKTGNEIKITTPVCLLPITD